jgi:MFS family permease
VPESTSLTPPRASAPAPSGRHRRLGLVVLSLGVSLVVVDATIMGVLLPRIVSDLSLSTSDAEWATSVYSLVFAALLIPFGRAGDLVGRRRVFVLGVAVFAAASLGAVLAPGGPSPSASGAR